VYFEAKMAELKDMVDIFKACRLFDPSRAAAQCAHADEVERQLKLFPFIDDAKVALLVRDLPAYLVHVQHHPITRGGDGELEYEAWWHACAGVNDMGVWYEVATTVLILQPSSAAAERVFSMLKNLMGDQQQARSMEDYQEAAIMSRYNQLQRYKK
jgi:hypothetical protein